jgi:hypothetical protein
VVLDLIQTLIHSLTKAPSETRFAKSGSVTSALTQLPGFGRTGPREPSANSSAEHSRLSWTVTRDLTDSERKDLLDHIESLIFSGEFKVSGPQATEPTGLGSLFIDGCSVIVWEPVLG